MKSFEYSGMWWLPTQQEHKVPGIARFADDDRINLALNGLLEPEQGSGLPDLPLKKYPLILGLTDEGLAITLFDCFDTNLTISLGGDSKQQCLAHVAYLGAHLTVPQEMRFNKIDACYSYLPQWAGVFPFRGFQKPFDEIRAFTTKGVISVHPTRPLGIEWIAETELAEAVCVTIESQEALSLEEWNVQFIFPLQNLLSLATQRPNFLVSLQAYIKQNVVTQSDTDLSEIPVQIVYPPAFVPFAPSRTVFPGTILFSLQEIADDFSNMMDSWLNVADELNSVCSLFFGVQYTKLYLDQRFLFIAQAAEVYQSRRTERLYLPENEFQDLIQIILAGCPEAHRDWLEEKIHYSNRPTFRRHLKDLADKVADIMLPLIRERGYNKSTFTNIVYNTRNYLTHHTRELNPEAAQGDELFFITQYLSITVQACLFYELGFTTQRCIEMFRKHEVYQYLLRQQPYSS